MNWFQTSKRFLSQMALAVVLVNLLSTSALAASSGLIVSAGADRSVTLGDLLTIDATDLADSNAVYAQNLATGTFSGTLNWGDGTTEDVTSAMYTSAEAIYFQGAHIYGAMGTYTVEACFDDDGAGYLCDSFSVEVTEALEPDLTVTDIRYDDPDGDGLYYVYADLANIGNMDVDPALGGVNIGYLNGVEEIAYTWDTLSPSNQAFLLAGGTDGGSYSALGGNKALVDGDVIEVCVDTSNVVVESEEANNCYVETVTLGAPLPDFTVSDVYAWDFALGAYVYEADFVIPSAITDYVVYTDITNLAADASSVDPASVYFELCDTDCDTDSAPLIQHTGGFFGDTDFLTPGGTSTDNSEEIYIGMVDTSAVASFEYCIDTTNAVAEADETNNCYTFLNPFYTGSPVLPDLNVSDVSVDPVAYSLDITVNNLGLGDVGEDAEPEMTLVMTTPEDGSSPIMDYVLEDYITADADFRIAGETMIVSLPAGGSGFEEYCSTATVEESTWTFSTIVDSTESVEESDEENNTYEETFDICAGVRESSSGPDMTLTLGALSELVVPYTVGNEGDEDVDPSVITGNLGANYFYLDGVWMGQARWYWHSVSALRYTQAGNSQTRNIYFYFYDDFATLSEGTHTLTACTDATDAVSETNEENNCSDLEFEWTVDMLPDLFASALSIDTATGDFNYGLGNMGATDVWWGFGYNAIYLNGSAVVTQLWYTDTNYNYLTAMTTEARTSTLDTSLFVEGTNEVEVCIDSTNKILSELDEINNCSTLSFEYTVPEETTEIFMVEAGSDQAVALHDTFLLDTEAYAYDFATNPLTTATVNWGDGTSDAAVQLVSGDLIYLQGSHVYTVPGSYVVKLCANDGVSDACDQFTLSVVGSSSSDDTTSSSSSSGGSSSGTSDGSSGGSSGGSSSSSDDDEDVELSGEDDTTTGGSSDGSTDADVEVASEEETCSAMTFEDIVEGASYHESLEALWCMGVIHGRSATVFAPEDEMRRDEASKVFTRLFGYVTVPYDEAPMLEEGSFSDVDLSEPLAYYVEVATQEGIMTYETSEDGQAYFNPHDAVTVDEIISALTVITGTDATDAVTDAGYEAGETITRGNFLELVYSFME